VVGVALPSAESLSAFAGLLADRSRAAICLALVDGRAWTAGELARHAGIAASTASEHLDRLLAAGLLAEERQGRHRYVRLADSGIAQVVEDLAAAVGVAVRPTGLRVSREAERLRAARTCYDHLAGRFGTELYDGLVATGRLDDRSGLALTPAGRAWVEQEFGAEALHPSTSRPLVRTCLDWTERRAHLGGALAATMCASLDRRGWIVRRPGDRQVTVTAAGSAALRDQWGVEVLGAAAP
jgi:DNA-binding transcriptional ArsR family regulator